MAIGDQQHEIQFRGAFFTVSIDVTKAHHETTYHDDRGSFGPDGYVVDAIEVVGVFSERNRVFTTPSCRLRNVLQKLIESNRELWNTISEHYAYNL